MKNTMIDRVLIVVGLAITLTACVTAPVDEELVVVRPGGDGYPYWNQHSIMFMYPPKFDFKYDAGKDKKVQFRYDVSCGCGTNLTFWSRRPDESLASVWKRIPVGVTTVKVTAVSRNFTGKGDVGQRVFWRKAPFREGTYPKATDDYGNCARRILAYQFQSEPFQYILKNGTMKPDGGSRYPSKQLSALIVAMVGYAKQDPSVAADAILMSRKAADHLLSISEPATNRYPHFTPTYHPLKECGSYEWHRHRSSMNVYPASAADAFLALYDATGDRRYYDAARGIAETYLTFQGKDGTWPLVVDLDKGPTGRNRLIPLGVMGLMEKFYERTGEAKFRESADRAFAYIERTLISTWNWEGQFEDTPPTERYRNLTKHPACSTAIYMLKRFPNDSKKLALARELLRFAEDQFVNWERPYPHGEVPDPKTLTGYYNHFWSQPKWIAPSVCEQYGCYTPVDASAAKLIRTYLALYRAEGNPVDLAKARTLGDTVTRMTDERGCESTWWSEDQLGKDLWPNCMFATAAAMAELATYQGATSSLDR